LSRFRLAVPIPLDINVSTDGRVLVFAVTLSVITGVIFSLIPAWRATKPDLIGSIKNDTGSIASLRRFGLRNVLVVMQVGISTVLLICSGLFLRSLDAARNVDSGMDT
jgi:putative ABC transport system permease protein